MRGDTTPVHLHGASRAILGVCASDYDGSKNGRVRLRVLAGYAPYSRSVKSRYSDSKRECRCFTWSDGDVIGLEVDVDRGTLTDTKRVRNRHYHGYCCIIPPESHCVGLSS